MTGLTDLVGVLINCGMIASGETRIVNAMGASGLERAAGLLQHQEVTNRRRTNTNANIKSGSKVPGLLFKMLTRVLANSSPKSVLTFVGFRALPDGLFDDKPAASTKGSSQGGEAMALLVIMVFQAFKKVNRQAPAGMQAAIGSSEILLGLRMPFNAEEEKELEQTASLIIRGMINAAKAGSQISHAETQIIINRIRESDSSDEIQRLIFKEMQLPLNLDNLVIEIPNEAVAALVYAASLFAIEVDTVAEREYLEQFVKRTGLDPRVAQRLQNSVGVH